MEPSDDATPVCLRCFAPLVGAPTTCPNCGAGASRSAMLGPSVAGGVDVGGGPPGPWLQSPRRGLTVWTYLIVWILGLLFIPPMIQVGRYRGAGFWSAHVHPSPLQVSIVLGWTILFWWLVLREVRKPSNDVTASDDPPTGS